MEPNPRRSWPVGYCPSEDIRSILEPGKKANLFRSILATLADYTKVSVGAYIGVIAYAHLSFPITLLIHLVVWSFIAHAQRGLENLIHEASHKNWIRRTRLNDLLADALAALPVARTIRVYRTAHKAHHEHYGTAQDTDKQDYEALEIENIRRESPLSFWVDVFRRLPRYALRSWRPLRKSWKPVAVFHLVLVMVLCLIFGPATGAALWLFYWAVPLVFFLTPLRLVAESSEHIYQEGRTVMDTTVTNSGWVQRYFIHPHNDGYHTLHHLCPTIPHTNLKNVHQQLLKADPVNYGARLRFRDRIARKAFAGEQSSPRFAGHRIVGDRQA